MKNRLFLSVFIWIFFVPLLQAQVMMGRGSGYDEKNYPYRGEKPRINDLVHTQLDVVPHFATHTLDGKALITLTPHFYPTDSLTLDAKSMLIHEVKVDTDSVAYTYDGKKLRIRLPRTYRRGEHYQVYVSYTARPDSVKPVRGHAITGNKGLYFIEAQPGRYPAQFWTQGEPESNSVWFPTIDSPNQKSTEQISITVPQEWVTLSNGVKIKSVTHPDRTRTDTWRLDKPHAPYLFFMAGGPFAIVTDSAGNMPIHYYVEPKYKDVAKQIFGKTPEMIRYFSQLTGVRYPWPSFNQIVTRNFVSGAMENTTAVNHSEMAYQSADQLIDGNAWEDVIAHELFHHWFGDLVTSESWAQIAMNESFADYSEALWEEHDEGPDKRDYKLDQDRQMYLMMQNAYTKPLVRYHYGNPDDVFDVVSYQKGGVILHMLRHTLGDSAFFAGWRQYLHDNAYGTGEASQLRLALEKVSGRDLKPFFDQWFYGSGHPVLDIQYHYHDTTGGGRLHLTVTQRTKKIWQIPLEVDAYEEDTPRHYRFQLSDSVQTFSIPYRKHPRLVNIDPSHTLLAVINDPRPAETYYYQFYHARNYMDRKMGLDKAKENKDSREAFRVIVAALDDPFYVLRRRAIMILDVKSPYFNRRIESKLRQMALYDRHTTVQAAALLKLGELKKKKYLPLFEKMIHSPSKAVREAAFRALSMTDPDKTARIVDRLSEDEKEKLGIEIARFYAARRTPGTETFIVRHLLKDPIQFLVHIQTDKDVAEAMKWITSGDNVEANRLVADGLVKLAGQFDMPGLKNFIKMLFRSYMKNQSGNKGPHHEQIARYYQTAWEKLKN